MSLDARGCDSHPGYAPPGCRAHTTHPRSSSGDSATRLLRRTSARYVIDSPTPKTDQDRLNIIAHDRFQDIIDDANRADSPIKLKTLILEAPGADDERLQSLWNYRQFYLEFPILSTAWRELSWSHFRMLLRVKGRGNHQNTFVIARPQAVAIHRPQSAAMDCRATLAMT